MVLVFLPDELAQLVEKDTEVRDFFEDHDVVVVRIGILDGGG